MINFLVPLLATLTASLSSKGVASRRAARACLGSTNHLECPRYHSPPSGQESEALLQEEEPSFRSIGYNTMHTTNPTEPS
uniref:Putative secreted protein n=1 Tax=Anopheles darlingi TaxID=43151 RepID=A0A2M4DJQ9_ANODA